MEHNFKSRIYPIKRMNEFIFVIHNMIDAMHSMLRKMSWHWGKDEHPEERRTPKDMIGGIRRIFNRIKMRGRLNDQLRGLRSLDVR